MGLSIFCAKFLSAVNLFSRFFSASALLSLSAFNLFCLASCLSNLLFPFKVLRIELTIFEMSDRILTTDSFCSFFSAFSSSLSSGLTDDGTSDDDGLTTSAPPLLPPIAVPFLNESADIFVLFALNLGSAAFLCFLTFTTSCDKIAERSSPEPLV